MTVFLEGKIKDLAAVFAGVAVIWSFVSGIVAFILIDPVVAWADERYVGEEDFSRYVARSELRNSCQHAETQLDQVNRLIGRLTPQTAQEIRNDYEKQQKKHKNRFDKWGCTEVLDSIAINPN